MIRFMVAETVKYINTYVNSFVNYRLLLFKINLIFYVCIYVKATLKVKFNNIKNFQWWEYKEIFSLKNKIIVLYRVK